MHSQRDSSTQSSEEMVMNDCIRRHWFEMFVMIQQFVEVKFFLKIN